MGDFNGPDSPRWRVGGERPGAAAGGPVRQALAPLPHPFAIPVKAQRCTRLIPTGGREIIVNSCGACRTVGITRKRPGIAVPVIRSFNVPAKSTFPIHIMTLSHAHHGISSVV